MKNFYHLILLILTILQTVLGYSRCNFRLMNNFQLRGLEIALSDSMHVCPAVRTRCCSLMDEIRILQYWRQVTHPKILDYSGTMMRYFGVFLNFFEYFTQIDKQEIVYHYLYFAKMKYINRYCLETNLIVEETPQDAQNNIQELVPGDLGEDLYKLNPNNPLEVDDLFTKMAYDESKDLIASISEMLQEIGGAVVAQKRKEDAFRLAEKQDSESIIKLRKAQKKEEEDIKKQIEKQKKDNLLTDIGLKAPDIKLPNIVPPRIPDSVKFANLSQEDKELKQKFDQMGFKFPHQHYTMANIRRFMNIYKSQEKILKEPFQPEIRKQFRSSKGFGPKFPKQIPVIPFQRRNIPKIECGQKNEKFLRPFVVANYEKLKYCHQIIDSFFEINIQEYLEKLPKIRVQLNRTLDLKKTFYCDICDFNKQQFFDFQNQRIIYNRKFCKNLLQSNKDYIEFNNIIFIKYLDQMLQIRKCFENSGNLFMIPFETILQPLLQRIPFVEECLENLQSDDFYRYCRFICIDYKMNDFSEIIEGHQDLFNQAYTLILGFLTKQTDAQHLTLATIERQKLKNNIQKIEDILAASKYPSKKQLKKQAQKLSGLIEETREQIKQIPQFIQDDFYDFSITNESLKEKIKDFEEYEPKDIFQSNNEPSDEEENLGFQEHRISPEFYLKAKQPVKMNNFKSFFSNHQLGLDPFDDITLVNFKYNITNLIRDQMYKVSVPKIQPTVIKNYLQITEKNLQDFVTDIDFKIDDQIKEKKASPIPPFKPKKVKFKKFKKTRNKTLDWLLPYLEKNNRDYREDNLDQLLHKLPKY